MFDVGFWEILLILVLALVIIGPERLPGAARKAGFFVGKARRYIEGVRNEVESELDINEFKRILHNQEVQINELQHQLKSGMEDIKADMPETLSSTDVLTEKSILSADATDAADDIVESTNSETDSSASIAAKTASQKHS